MIPWLWRQLETNDDTTTTATTTTTTTTAAAAAAAKDTNDTSNLQEICDDTWQIGQQVS